MPRSWPAERFFGTVPINGVDYYATIQPIKKMSAADKLNGPVMGAIFVGTPLAQVTAQMNSALQLIAMVGAGAIIGFGLLGLLASRLLTRPLPIWSVLLRGLPRANMTRTCPLPGAAMKSEPWPRRSMCSVKTGCASAR
ncbi:hypothetical protein N8D56_06025 [Devosia sp. A8/3-2]|nr:hypothetical protein N8D56_06025 [Devosia sp. A8/3-2]